MSKGLTTTKQETRGHEAPLAVTPAGTEIATAMHSAADWGVAEQNLTSRDVLIPKIFAMQAMSKPVTAGEAKFGEFRDSLNGTVLGDTKTPVEFVPFYMEKTYVIFAEVNGAWKFARTVPIVPENEGAEFEHTFNGVKEKWYRTLNFYVLLPKDIETQIPYMISFRSSSSRGGQKLATTMFMKNIKAALTPASTVMELWGTKTSNDKGTYIVMDVKEKRRATAKEVNTAYDWVKVVKAGKMKVDHSDLIEEEIKTASKAPDDGEY